MASKNEQISKIKCEECESYFSNMGTHLKTHNLTSKEYTKKHPEADIVSKAYREKHRQNAILRYTDKNFRKKAGSRTFDFLKNKDLRSLLQRDYKSAKISLNNQLWKPSIVLYGSIIEAILIEKTGAKTFEKSLYIALNKKFISEKDYHKIHMIRDLRNFVHIHKELKEKEEINDYWAKTFADICESIIKHFKK